MIKTQSQIKNIIFDLGGVILNIDPSLTAKAMKELGVDRFEEAYSGAKQNHLVDKLEKGFVTPEEFRDGVRNAFKTDLSNDKIDTAWGALLLDFPKERIELIQSLKTKYRLFLLSNSNKIHYHMYDDDLFLNFGIRLNSLFEKAYYSFEMGMRKPEIEIYRCALKESSLNPSETLFIDDLKVNIEAANEVGLETHHLDLAKGESINTVLHSF